MANWTLLERNLTDGEPMRFYIAERDGAICTAAIADDVHPKSLEEFEWRLGRGEWVRREERSCPGVLRDAVRQVNEYCSGKRAGFDLPLHFEGTVFQQKVWRELTRIPFGETRSYADVAESIDCPNAQRAVGGANGKNRIPLFVPCHRVIASGGRLGGFTGGLGLKIRLLVHEDCVRGVKTPWQSLRG